jgi:hypothetical protein
VLAAPVAPVGPVTLGPVGPTIPCGPVTPAGPVGPIDIVLAIQLPPVASQVQVIVPEVYVCPFVGPVGKFNAAIISITYLLLYCISYDYDT